jgi:hypothetical protein
MKRGVLFVWWGGNGQRKFLDRSIASVQRVHPDLPIAVRELPATATLLEKASMWELSPFESTLYLDTDTVVLDDLTFGFDMAEKWGLALAICEAPWAARYPTISGDMVEYNSGVMFFRKDQTQALFNRWIAAARTIESSITWRDGDQLKRMQLNDQAGLAVALSEWDRVPFILPLNWNLRPTWQRYWFGRLKVWHDYRDVPATLLRENAHTDPTHFYSIKD